MTDPDLDSEPTDADADLDSEPTDADADLDSELIDALRERGQRVTMPRLLVHRLVRRSEGHLTPERLHARLAPAHPGLSPATIYSTLELLDELGFVRRVSTPR